jgi:hypothetical protein
MRITTGNLLNAARSRALTAADGIRREVLALSARGDTVAQQPG